MNIIKTFANGGYKSTTTGNLNEIFHLDGIACKGLAAFRQELYIWITAGGLLLRPIRIG